MEAIQAIAKLRFGRISPQKTRLVADMIRGKNVEDAKRILRFSTKKGAAMLLKVLNSAVANAEVKNVEDTEILTVDEVYVGQGPSHRRYRPRARGRADILRRPTSHITLIVKEDVKAKEEAAARAAQIEAKKAKKRAAKKASSKKKETPAKVKKEETPAKKKAVAVKKKKEADEPAGKPEEKKTTPKKKSVSAKKEK